VKILYFASLRQTLSIAAEDVTPPPSVTTVGSLRAWLAEQSPRHRSALADTVRLCAAVNQDYAAMDQPIRASDEVAFFPPVTGG
jgi:molybdopterin synthase sulfur carrier subunit